MSVLEMRRVTKRHGPGLNEVHALRGVDLSVDAGELVAVMGPSGSGKSTLLTIAGSLEEQARRFPDELSGGERQRVAVARAVVGERQLLLADEPSGALDSENGEAVMRLVHTACRRGVAGVFVTHDAQLAAWADRIVFLRDGRIVDATAPAPGPESLLAPGASA